MEISTSSETYIFENSGSLELTTMWKTTNGKRWTSQRTSQRTCLRRPILSLQETTQNSSAFECMWWYYLTSTQETISQMTFRKSKDMKCHIQEYDREWSYAMCLESHSQEEMSLETPWLRCLSRSRRVNSSSKTRNLNSNPKRSHFQNQSEKWKMNFLSLRLKMCIPLPLSLKIKYSLDSRFTTDKRWLRRWTNLFESQKQRIQKQKVFQWKLRKL